MSMQTNHQEQKLDGATTVTIYPALKQYQSRNTEVDIYDSDSSSNEAEFNPKIIQICAGISKLHFDTITTSLDTIDFESENDDLWDKHGDGFALTNDGSNLFKSQFKHVIEKLKMELPTKTEKTTKDDKNVKEIDKHLQASYHDVDMMNLAFNLEHLHLHLEDDAKYDILKGADAVYNPYLNDSDLMKCIDKFNPKSNKKFEEKHDKAKTLPINNKTEIDEIWQKKYGLPLSPESVKQIIKNKNEHDKELFFKNIKILQNKLKNINSITERNSTLPNDDNDEDDDITKNTMHVDD